MTDLSTSGTAYAEITPLPFTAYQRARINDAAQHADEAHRCHLLAIYALSDANVVASEEDDDWLSDTLCNDANLAGHIRGLAKGQRRVPERTLEEMLEKAAVAYREDRAKRGRRA